MKSKLILKPKLETNIIIYNTGKYLITLLSQTKIIYNGNFNLRITVFIQRILIIKIKAKYKVLIHKVYVYSVYQLFIYRHLQTTAWK